MIEQIFNSKITVNLIGDTVLDCYHQVQCNRLSPEFPIPVMLEEDKNPTKILPGGASLVFNQFKNWKNVEVKLFSILDIEASIFLNSIGINTQNCFIAGTALTPRKSRYYHENFPLCRKDTEKKNYGFESLKEAQNRIFKNLQKYQADVIIFSDYAKGMFYDNPYLPEMMKLGKLRIVDPKDQPIDKWTGCHIFKPNSLEAEKFTKSKCPKHQLKLLGEKFPEVVITRGGKGFDTLENSYKETPINAESVIGAGDCFVAYLALAKACGYDTFESAKFAYEAGKIFVQNNKPLNILDFLGKKVRPEYLQNRDFTLGLANGVFDLLHTAHADLLKFAKSKCDKLVVALNSDESTRRLKGTERPINCLEDRIKVIESLEFVDYVIPFDEDTPYELIKTIKPNLIVKGGDYRKEQVVGNDLAEVAIFPYREGISTSIIAEKIKRL